VAVTAAFLAGRALGAPTDAGRLEPFLAETAPTSPAEVAALARAALSVRIATVVDKPQPSPTGDAHDYVSYARYYWPNPGTPDHLPFVRRDGRSNTDQVDLGDEPRLDAMAENVGRLALAWERLHREDCAARAVAWLRAWFLDPATAMRPNLDFAQVALGHDANRGRGEGILDARVFIGLVDAIRRLHGSAALTGADESALHDWFAQYLRWMLDSRNGDASHSAPNNHGTWFLAQAIAVARFVGRDDIGRRLAREDFARIENQIEPDGRQPLELARADSLSYSAFNLAAHFTVAQLAAGLGVDIAHYRAPNGASLAAAVAFLAPYNADPARWPGAQARRLKPGFLDEMLAEERAMGAR
jgi:hypothetical protein